MSFVTGLLLIDAPASALNNLGNIEGERYDNTSGVKVIKARDGSYPYVSAQAFRYWLRNTLAAQVPAWKPAPIYREEKVAYTDANPIKFWDDDLFGYMRAPSKKESAKAKRDNDASRAGQTETTDTITRVAPFRVSTLVSVGPVNLTEDFGVMSRHEGDPVPFAHQFYRATLKGMFSLDLGACGTFSYRQKTGFRHLDDTRIELAKAAGLKELPDEKSYQLPASERIDRVTALFEGLAQLEGGAKQTLHYTDVMPALTILAVTKGGNNIFAHVVGPTDRSLPKMKVDALAQALEVFEDDILSPVYVGWVKGYQDGERAAFEQALSDGPLAAFKDKIVILHPREAFQKMAQTLRANPGWLD